VVALAITASGATATPSPSGRVAFSAGSHPHDHVLFTAGVIWVVRRDGSGLRSVPLHATLAPALADWVG
jgi:hypothetical protein